MRFRSTTAIVLIFSFCAALLQPTWVNASPPIRSFTMQGESMFPTLHNGETLRVNMSAYRHSTPARGDIVLFRAIPAGQPDKFFIKRVIGLPGETVSIHNAAVYINHHRLKEPYVPAAYRPLYSYGPARVPKNEYFVLGDNRNNSQDSHLWGMLEKRYIVGKVILVAPSSAHSGIISVPTALQMCSAARGREFRVTVEGYVRQNNSRLARTNLGPTIFSGVLIADKNVPNNAANDVGHLRRFHGLPFGLTTGSALARTEQFKLVQPFLASAEKLIVQGMLFCRHSGLDTLSPIALQAATTSMKHATFWVQSGPFTFSYPASWTMYRPKDYHFTFDIMFAYVGNVRLSDPCTRTSSSLACAPFPPGRLAPGGVVVSWDSVTSLYPPDIHLNGRQLKLKVGPATLNTRSGRAFGCPVGTERSLLVKVYRNGVRSYFYVTACLRRPQIALHQQQVLAMLHSLHNG